MIGRPLLRRLSLRSFSFSARRPAAGDTYEPGTIEREGDDVDVCIVGGGPAGLSAAIRLKQLEKEEGKELRVVVLEKGSEVGEYYGVFHVNVYKSFFMK